MFNTYEVGDIVRLTNAGMLSRKQNSNGSECHPHVVVGHTSRNGNVALELVAISSTADMVGERNRVHWLPPTLAYGGLTRPSFLALNHGIYVAELFEVRNAHGYLAPPLVDMVLEFVDRYDEWCEVSPEYFIPRRGAGQQYSTARFVPTTTAAAFRAMGLKPMALTTCEVECRKSVLR